MNTKIKLQILLNEYQDMHGIKPVSKSVLNTWLCGHLHTFPRMANDIIEEMKFADLITLKNGFVKIKN